MSFKNKMCFRFTIIMFVFVRGLFAQAYQPNTLIVKLKQENKSLFSKESFIKQIGSDIETVTPVFESKVKSKNNLSSIYRIKYNSDTDALVRSKQVEEMGYFEYCEPVYYQELLYDTNDPYATSQYVLSLCKVFEAWDIHKGDSTVTIGVTDTGVDFDHPDLRSNVAYNLNDMIDGVDNDYDGYIDNYMGWDLGSDDNNPQWDQDGLGNQRHGVLTCGLAGARTDNNIGMSSIGFNTKFLPIKISNDNGYVTRGYEGVVYAAHHGCKIINCSWGSTIISLFGRDVIRYVTEDLGAVVVAAAGNQGNEYPYYPASFDNVVSVAASTSEDFKWESSTYNWRVDIVAPGYNVRSTLNGGAYANRSGTSYASPIVAGALALLYSYYPDTLSNKQLIEILKSTGDIIDTIANNLPYKNKMGKSRLNVRRALEGNFSYAINSSDFKLVKNQRLAYIGDTASVSMNITNYLLPIHNLKVTVRSLTPGVTVLGDSSFVVPRMGEEEQINSLDNNINVFISQDSYQKINFLVQYEADGFYTEEIRQVLLSYPYMDICNINRINTSLFSNGILGRNSSGKGIGLKLDDGDDILSQMGIVLSNRSNKLISNILNYNDLIASSIVDSIRTENLWQAEAHYANNSILPVRVKTEYQILLNDTIDNSIIINYQIINQSDLDCEDIHLSLFADWDIGFEQTNYSDIDTALQLAQVRSYSVNTIAGIQLLSPVPWKRYAFDNTNGTESVNGSNGFGRAELCFMSNNNNFYEGILQNGVDIIDVMTAGPLHINAYDTINLSFALIADTSIVSFKEEAKDLRRYYNTLHDIAFSLPKVNLQGDVKVYPTICKDRLYIDTQNNFEEIKLYNLQGKIVKKIKANKQSVYLGGLPQGMYLIRIGSFVDKIIVIE